MKSSKGYSDCVTASNHVYKAYLELRVALVEASEATRQAEEDANAIKDQESDQAYSAHALARKMARGHKAIQTLYRQAEKLNSRLNDLCG